MNDADLNQGDGPNPPREGWADYMLAIALAFCLFQALMFWWESPVN